MRYVDDDPPDSNINSDDTSANSGLLEMPSVDSKNKNKTTMTKVVQTFLSAVSSTFTTVRNISTVSAKDQKFALMEDTINIIEEALVSFSNEINAFADERSVLLETPESRLNDQRLILLKEKLADLRKRENKLAWHFKSLKERLHSKKHPKKTYTYVTEQGIV
jgi:hypothetical protein